jgi:hypothetical protein
MDLNALIFALSWNMPIMGTYFKRYNNAKKIKAVSQKTNFGK